MKLHCQTIDAEYEFIPVRLSFEGKLRSEIFGQKNNKTVLETLTHRRYASLRQRAEKDYPRHLHEPLGSFLLSLKQSGDDFYRRFLNKYGDEAYSTFRIDDEGILDKRGIYAYTVDEKLNYIGRCRDSMRKRVNQGYGKIHPKNCYLDGQSTNCHLNSRITAQGGAVCLWFCELDPADIIQTEKVLIAEYGPPWNKRLS